MNAYIRMLRERSAERRAATAAERAHNARPLENKIQEHFAALPPEERRTHYTMDELVLIFNAAPGRIGTALHRLGWKRRRSWREGQSYARFWISAQ